VGALLEDPGGGLLYWVSGRIWGGGLRGQAFLSVEGTLGRIWGGGLRGQAFLSVEGTLGRIWGGGLKGQAFLCVEGTLGSLVRCLSARG
jgi:hypothetical protein